jgi:stalled ribosome alternative rescue factor ArfA
MQISLLVQKMVIQFKKRNKIAVDLFSNKWRKRVIKPKKGKGSFKRKKPS